MLHKFIWIFSIFFLSSQSISTIFAKAQPGSNGDLKATTRLLDVSLYCAHNMPMSYYYGWVYAQQSKSPSELFNKAGVRCFKTPVGFYHQKKASNKIKKLFGKKTTSNPPQIVLMHGDQPGKDNMKLTRLQMGGKEPVPLEKLLKEVADFINKNPNEYMYIILENYLHEGHQSEKNVPKKYTKNGKFSEAEVGAQLDSLLEKTGVAPHIRKVGSLEEFNRLTLGDLRENKKTIILVGDGRLANSSRYISQGMNQGPHWADKEYKTCEWYGARDTNRILIMNLNPENSVNKNKQKAVALLLKGPLSSLIKNKTGALFKGYDYKKINSLPNIKARFNTCAARYPDIFNRNGIYLSTDYNNEGNAIQWIDARNKKFE